MWSGCTVWSATLTGKSPPSHLLPFHCSVVFSPSPLPLPLRYIIQRVPSGGMSGATELAKTLVAHLSLLVSDLDPLETTLSMLSHRTVQQTCCGHMTRLSLHVHWTALCITFRMIPQLGEGVREMAFTSVSCDPLLSLKGCPHSCSRPTALWLPSSAMQPPHGTASRSSQYETLPLTPPSLPHPSSLSSAGGGDWSDEGRGGSVAM